MNNFNSIQEKFDICIIGAGVVGLSTAYHLKYLKPELHICILEKEDGPSHHQTGRNSGVIHSGIYYKPSSLKAQFCREGRSEMYNFCAQNNIPFKKTGKLIVAKDFHECERLIDLLNRGKQNGLDIDLLDKAEMNKVEPYCQGLNALFVRETGIADYIKLSSVLQKLFLDSGGHCKFSAKAKKINANILSYIQDNQENKIQCKVIINCAGVHSDEFLKGSSLKIIPFRGEYFSIKNTKSNRVSKLIYPVPDPRFPFLGVHFTRSIYDHVHVGPNAVLALAKEGYKKTNFELASLKYLLSRQMAGLATRYLNVGIKEQFRSLSKKIFLESARELIPDLDMEDLEQDTPGIRAQAVENWGHLVDDFRIVSKENCIHVLNAPSPAATSSLPIGRYIAENAIKLL